MKWTPYIENAERYKIYFQGYINLGSCLVWLDFADGYLAHPIEIDDVQGVGVCLLNDIQRALKYPPYSMDASGCWPRLFPLFGQFLIRYEHDAPLEVQ